MQSLQVFVFLAALVLASAQRKCIEETVTTASGTYAPAPGTFGSGDLIFEETFDDFDFSKWEHENTLAGGGNWEFQWYANNRSNSYVEDGRLHIVPTLMADEFGEGFLSSGNLNVHGGAPADQCTNPLFWGCERQGNPQNIINPIKSARIRTVNSFAFKYGTIEIRAKMPAGDWLWPALWMMPKMNAYGGWPSSGEIDIMEGRGNRRLFNGDVNVGTEQVGHTLHFGPRFDTNGWPTAHNTFNQVPGFNEDFNVFRLVWTEDSLTFFVNNRQTAKFEAGDGFWKRAGFDTTGRDNPWKRSKSLLAPFDQEFYLIMNLAVGGVGYFVDSFKNEGATKPWSNTSPTAMLDFWNGRPGWLPTWKPGTDDSHLQVDYVRVWAL